MTKSKLRIYGCGGAGINIVNLLTLPKEINYLPDVSYTLIDTSKSNISENRNDGNIFLVPGVDGTGKDQKFAFELMKPYVNDILLSNPPLTTNFVIFSLCGGTGSTSALLIIEELIKRKETVIAIGIISTTDLKQSKNSFNTLNNLQHLSRNILKKPIVTAFYENTTSNTRGIVDGQITDHVRALAMLVSGTNEALDSKDIANWLNFDRHSQVPPQLVDLHVHLANKDTVSNTKSLPSAISVASLLMNSNEPELELNSLYSCTGYFSTEAQKTYSTEVPSMHFIITNEYLNGRVDNLNKCIADHESNKNTILAVPIPLLDDGKGDFLFQ